MQIIKEKLQERKNIQKEKRLMSMMSATSMTLPPAAANGAIENVEPQNNITANQTMALQHPTTKSTSKSSAADKLNNVVLQGYLKKQKTMKKKYFVLVSEKSSDNGEKPARLEYYESEKKFRSRFGHPKRSIVLKSCFHISQRPDTKQKYVIALYTREDSFCIVMENENEMNKWLKALQTLHRNDESEVDIPRTTFEHVWEVQVHRRGLAVEKNIVGTYHLCLTDKALRLSQTGSKTTQTGERRMPYVEFLLTTIRRCGDSQRFFYMEVGRHSAIGAGELYMETEDPLIAQNMHTTIINAMSSNRNREEFGPVTRNRSSSANEASKPILVLQRRQTHTGNKPQNFSPSNASNDGLNLVRDRCGSLPSHNRTTSDGTAQVNIQNQSMPPPRTIPLAITGRPQSMYTNSYRHSPPVNSNHANQSVQLSPSLKTFSKSCSESDGSSLSIDEPDGCYTPDEGNSFPMKPYHPRTTSGSVIPEENADDFWSSSDQSIPNMNGSLSLPIGKMGGSVASIDSANQSRHNESPQSTYSHSPGNEQMSSGYMIMSPAGDYNNKTICAGSNSYAHSHASSLTEDCVDSYVPVQSGIRPSTEEYIDMETQPRQRAITNSSISSVASSCSITSGTPSTDFRFAEYQLDKVVSHFTPDDDEGNMFIDRPVRAYSVGSRLEHNKRKMRVDLLTQEHGNNSTSRVRAFSVGSRAKVARSDLHKCLANSTNLTKANSQDIVNLITTINNNKMNHSNQKAQNALNNINNNNNNNNKNNNKNHNNNKNNNNKNNNKSGPSGGNTKSNSTPLLVHSQRPKENGFNLNNAKSSSVDPMDDLMEIDFTKKNDDSASVDSNFDHKQSNRYDLMEVEYPHNYDGGSTSENIPKQSTSSSASMLHATQPVPISTKRNDASDTEGYMCMKPVGSSDSKHSPNLSSSPIKLMQRTATTSSPAMQRSQQMARIHQTSLNSDDYLNMSPINARTATAAKSSSQQLQQPHVGSGSAPDGYMEMSWANKTNLNSNNSNTSNNNNNNNNNNSDRLIQSNLERNRQSSSSSISSSNEYIHMNYNMNYNSNIPRTSSASSDCSSSSLEPGNNHIESRSSRLRSLPITIVGKKSQTPQNHAKQSVTHQPTNHMLHCFGIGKTNPPTYLSLNTDLANQAAQSQSNSSECSVTTPIADGTTNNAAIFPFSPNSPSAGANKQIFSSQSTNNTEDQKRKCLVDCSTGTLRLSEGNGALHSTGSESHRAANATVDGLSSDYADMTIGNGSNRMQNTGPTLSPKENIKKLKSSFFGCNQIDDVKMDCSNAANSRANTYCDDSFSDYTIMNPVLPNTGRRVVAQQPPLQSMSTCSNAMPLTKKTVLVTSNNNPDKVKDKVKTSVEGFRPITSRADKEVSKQYTKSTANTIFSRHHSVPVDKSRKPSEDSGAYEQLELRSSSSATAVTAANRTTRPNSVNSEKTPFTPLIRPNSANSERHSSSAFSLTSTPLTESGNQSMRSSSSTLCGSGTIGRPQSSTFLSSGSEYSQSSRPSSVVSVIEQQTQNSQTTTAITSRPPSVSSERELHTLHYASLDLPKYSSTAATPLANHGNQLSANIQNPIATTEAPTFTYAQIDFVKSTEHNTSPSPSTSSNNNSNSNSNSNSSS